MHVTYPIRICLRYASLRARLPSTNQRQYGVGARALSLACPVPRLAPPNLIVLAVLVRRGAPARYSLVRPQTRELSSVQRPRKTLGRRCSSWRPPPVSSVSSSHSFWCLIGGRCSFIHDCSRSVCASPLLASKPLSWDSELVSLGGPRAIFRGHHHARSFTLRKPSSLQGSRALVLPPFSAAAVFPSSHFRPLDYPFAFSLVCPVLGCSLRCRLSLDISPRAGAPRHSPRRTCTPPLSCCFSRCRVCIPLRSPSPSPFHGSPYSSAASPPILSLRQHPGAHQSTSATRALHGALPAVFFLVFFAFSAPVIHSADNSASPHSLRSPARILAPPPSPNPPSLFQVASDFLSSGSVE